jgi:hypothetical protein
LKRILKVIFALLLVLGFLSTQLLVHAELSLWPAKLEVNMKSFPDQPVTYKQIQIKNLRNQPALVKTQIVRPSENKYLEGYSSIPDLSWVSISPTEMTIPPKGEAFFNLTIDIPKENQPSCYNQSWEVQVLFYEPPTGVGASINVKLGCRVFIHAPKKTAEQWIHVNLLVLVWFIGMFGLAVATVVFYLRRRHSMYRQKAAMFYVKDKQQKQHKRK